MAKIQNHFIDDNADSINLNCVPTEEEARGAAEYDPELAKKCYLAFGMSLDEPIVAPPRQAPADSVLSPAKSKSRRKKPAAKAIAPAPPSASPRRRSKRSPASR